MVPYHSGTEPTWPAVLKRSEKLRRVNKTTACLVLGFERRNHVFLVEKTGEPGS